MDNVKKYLPDGATEIEQVSPYVYKYKTPWRNWINTDFIARMLADDIALAMGTDWRADSWDNDSPFLNLDVARIRNDSKNLVLMVRTQSYGVNAYSKFELSGWFTHPITKKTSRSIEIKVSSNKNAETIAKDIAKRMLPQMIESGASISDTESARLNALAELQKKCEGLARKYPEIKFSMQNDSEISVSTKYGSKIELSAEIRADNDCFRLISKGYGLRIDDIDSTYGREFLKLVNGGERNK